MELASEIIIRMILSKVEINLNWIAEFEMSSHFQFVLFWLLLLLMLMSLLAKYRKKSCAYFAINYLRPTSFNQSSNYIYYVFQKENYNNLIGFQHSFESDASRNNGEKYNESRIILGEAELADAKIKIPKHKISILILDFRLPTHSDTMTNPIFHHSCSHGACNWKKIWNNFQYHLHTNWYMKHTEVCVKMQEKKWKSRGKIYEFHITTLFNT